MIGYINAVWLALLFEGLKIPGFMPDCHDIFFLTVISTGHNRLRKDDIETKQSGMRERYLYFCVN